MGSEPQARWIRVLGVVVALLVLWEVLRFTLPSPDFPVEVAQPEYRLRDPETGVGVGEWVIVGGRSTLVLRDGHGMPCLVLQADPGRGGRIGIRDEKGQWHWYPPLPPG
jgi:hypothetical protein